MIRLLDYDIFRQNASLDPHWKSYRHRWIYHALAIEMARGLALTDRRRVLEIGTGGAQVVIGSKTMDLPAEKAPPWGRPTIEHDIKSIPWPIKSGRFDLLVALRVWHHLHPVQMEAFREAQRVARFIIICCPEWEHQGVGIPENTFREWSNPLQVEHTQGWGTVYLFEGNRE